MRIAVRLILTLALLSACSTSPGSSLDGGVTDTGLPSIFIPPFSTDAGRDARSSSKHDSGGPADTGSNAPEAATLDAPPDVAVVTLGNIGDPCVTGTDCASATCSPGGWCTQACASSADCGQSSAGLGNVCETDPSSNQTCFPICSSQTDCSSFSGEATTCSGDGQTYCQYPAACAATGTSCASATCCAGLACISGTCGTCSASGASCAGGCCSGLECLSSGKCGACGASGGSCSQASDCCSGLLCNAGKCGTCSASGGECSSDSACCSGLHCFGGTCGSCGAKWQECVGSDPCCGGLSCVGSTCSPPKPALANVTATAPPSGSATGGSIGDSSSGDGTNCDYVQCGAGAPVCASSLGGSSSTTCAASQNTNICLSVSGLSRSICTAACSTDADCPPLGHCIAFGSAGYCLDGCHPGSFNSETCMVAGTCKSLTKRQGGTVLACTMW